MCIRSVREGDGVKHIVLKMGEFLTEPKVVGGKSLLVFSIGKPRLS